MDGKFIQYILRRHISLRNFPILLFRGRCIVSHAILCKENETDFRLWLFLKDAWTEMDCLAKNKGLKKNANIRPKKEAVARGVITPHKLK